MKQNHPIELIGYACGVGAGDPGCQKGPQTLKDSQYLDDCLVAWHWHSILTANDSSQGLDALPTIADLCEQLANITQTLTKQGKAFATIAGDHTSGIGTWSGAATALAPQGPMGLIWSDAHMDAHTFTTTPSGNIHGMPVACLLGHGETKLTHISSPDAKIAPEHLCLIGIRDFESGEAELLESLNVRIITMDEVKQRGMADCMTEAITIACKNTVGFGISIDLDGFDPIAAPGVGTPVPDGLDCQSFCQTIQQQNLDKLVGIEIVEYNPERDLNNQTAKLFKPLLDSCFINKTSTI